MNALAQASSVLDQLMNELQQRTGGGGARIGAKATSSTPSSPYLHGPNGLWSYPGLERPVISTRIRPRGLAGSIPSRPTNTMNPLYPFLTGFTDPAESQPNGVCDDPPTAGQMKNCFQTAVFGRYSYQTRVIDITRLGQIINRGEFTDLQLMNDPLGTLTSQGNAGGSQGLTWPGQGGGSLSIMNEVRARMTELGVKFQNKLMNQLWDGNPANNTAGGGYAEFPGITRLVRTGVVDAVTGTTCPSMDSRIVDSNYQKVTDNTGNGNIVNVLTYLYRIQRETAKQMGLDPVDWAFVMRETLFYEITAVWPCNYLTYRCQTSAGNEAIVNATDAIELRDSMRQQQFLIVDGMRVDVIIDDAMTEQTSGDTNRITGSCFASDIYLLPMSVQGGQIASLYWEYFDFNGPNAAMSSEIVNASPLLSNYFWSDGGQYLWHFKPPTNWCIQYLALIEPRLILRTPFLAARIKNVQYCPLMHPRDAFPDDPYFVNGGATSRNTAPSWYNSYS